MYWATFKRRHHINSTAEHIKSILRTEIDLSAEISYDMPAIEAIRLMTTKYFCGQCAKRIDFATHKHYEGFCKTCYNALFPDKPKKKLYRTRKSPAKAKSQ